jgi:hypothetical protein
VALIFFININNHVPTSYLNISIWLKVMEVLGY